MSETLKSMPLEPLERLARLKADTPTSKSDDTFTDEKFATMLGISKRSVARWRVTGSIPWLTADTVAVNLGFHPYDVWGDEWLALDNYQLTQKDLDSIQVALAKALAETDEEQADRAAREAEEDEKRVGLAAAMAYGHRVLDRAEKEAISKRITDALNKQSA